MQVMRDAAAQLRAEPKYQGRILDDLEMAGVERLGDSSVILRARFRVAPLEQWNVRRDYLLRLYQAFNTHGINIPFPQVTVHMASAKGS